MEGEEGVSRGLAKGRIEDWGTHRVKRRGMRSCFLSSKEVGTLKGGGND